MRVEAAQRHEVHAYWFDGLLVLVVQGTHPESCWESQLERSVLAVWPPEFILSRHRTSEICLQVVTPFVLRGDFPLADSPDSVVVHHADGADQVRVETLPGQPEEPAEPEPPPEVDERQKVRVTAMSLRSLDEAIDLAFAKIASDGPADQSAARITRQWVTRGGVVGRTQYNVELVHVPWPWRWIQRRRNETAI